jgi:SWI/SNF-related matrix-associated actin-dependent regulator of chromatin subfamily A member 5
MFRMLDVLEDFLALRGISYARLDGSTCRPRRTLDIKLVNMPIPRMDVKLTIRYVTVSAGNFS